jgi:hypothetical protein
VAIVEEATKTLAYFNLPYSLCHRSADNLIADPLMAALVMVVGDEVRDRSVKRCLSHEHHLAQAFRSDRPHETLGEGIHVRRSVGR